jgi:hypothetical protein
MKAQPLPSENVNLALRCQIEHALAGRCGRGKAIQSETILLQLPATSTSHTSERRGSRSRAFAALERLVGYLKADPRFRATCPRACAQSQNIPTTTAVRKAKEMMAASTLSLILSSIVTSSAGMSRLSGAEHAAPRSGVYVCFTGVPSKFPRGGPLILLLNWASPGCPTLDAE